MVNGTPVVGKEFVVDVRLVSTGAQIGVRESRSIVGKIYLLQRKTLLTGTVFDDGVCKF